MDIFEQLRKWLRELLYRDGDIEERFIKLEQPKSWCFEFYTRTNKYNLVAKENYLGCQVSSRKPRAGEDWNRGNDLPDGKFNEETWIRIKNAIISYELVKIAKKQIEVFDEVETNKNE